MLIDDQVHILFVRSRVIQNIRNQDFHHALEPLGKPRKPPIVIVGHNIGFDLGMLEREGIHVVGTIHDTEKMLRLIDCDRGKNEDVLSARIDRLAPPGSLDRVLNYRLKNVVAQLLGLHMIGFNNTTPMASLPYPSHVLYLTSDLLGTAIFYHYLLGRLTPVEAAYHDRLISPLTPILVQMMETGITLDPVFLRSERMVLAELMESFSSKHEGLYGRALDAMNPRQVISWIFGELGLVAVDRIKRTPAQIRMRIPRGDPSLSDKHLKVLVTAYASNPRVVGSLKLIRSYRKLLWLRKDLKKFLQHLDSGTGRVHASLRDTLATGRIASTEPNLQGIPRAKVVAGITIRSRNVLTASEGYELVSFDISQADIRVMAHAVASFTQSGTSYLTNLRAERGQALAPFIQPHLDQLKAHINPAYKFNLFGTSEPTFNPKASDNLATILRGKSDLYRTVASQVTGQSNIDDPLRNTFKIVVLSMANSITPVGLAPRLGYGTDQEGVQLAKNLMDDFWKAYPKVRSYLDLMEWQVALTGQTSTWAGRPRVCTAHWWMCNLPRVEIKISFKGDHWYWLDIIPLRPGRHVLTCWVRKVWDNTFNSSNYGKLIYEDVKGVIPKIHFYRLFQPHRLLYLLPVRNIAWRSIRRVRTDTEESVYYGFDSTSRSLINSIFQGGTADIAKLMMIRCLPYCNWIRARLLLNIHDELVFEVPEHRVMEFIRTMKRLLELPPDSSWTIPIRVEPKHGVRFGLMEKPVAPIIPRPWGLLDG